MSNKNGEDTLRRQRHNAAIRILEDEDEEYKLNCICTLLESQQELASLREQLKQKDQRIKFVEELLNEDLHEENKSLKSKLQQQEKVIRELVALLDVIKNDFKEDMPITEWTIDQIEPLIKKAYEAIT